MLLTHLEQFGYNICLFATAQLCVSSTEALMLADQLEVQVAQQTEQLMVDSSPAVVTAFDSGVGTALPLIF